MENAGADHGATANMSQQEQLRHDLAIIRQEPTFQQDMMAFKTQLRMVAMGSRISMSNDFTIKFGANETTKEKAMYEYEGSRIGRIFDGLRQYPVTIVLSICATLIMCSYKITVPAVFVGYPILLSAFFAMKWLTSPSRKCDLSHDGEPAVWVPDWPKIKREYSKGDLSNRIGDVERDRVIKELGMHFSAGRLDLSEHDERSDQALRAKTGADLEIPLQGLPLINADGKLI